MQRCGPLARFRFRPVSAVTLGTRVTVPMAAARCPHVRSYGVLAKRMNFLYAGFLGKFSGDCCLVASTHLPTSVEDTLLKRSPMERHTLSQATVS